MNYYEHHIGDYDEATSHLTACEDGIYSRMIRKYYATEKPLPADINQVQRLVRARTREEKQAVKTILEEFFCLADDGWHNWRCDEEIARYQDKQAKAKRSAQVRWGAQRSQSDGNAGAMRTHSEGNAPRARIPLSSHQTPDSGEEIPPSVPPLQKPPPAATGSRLPREWGLPPEWRSWAVEQGLKTVDAEAERFRDYWLAKAGKDGRKADWQATWRNWVRKAMEQSGGGQQHAKGGGHSGRGRAPTATELAWSDAGVGNAFEPDA